LLTTFQFDIKNIGSEMKKLQDECFSQQTKLENRKQLEEKIGDFIGGTALPKDMVR
jgi:hypothetical protein